IHHLSLRSQIIESFTRAEIQPSAAPRGFSSRQAPRSLEAWFSPAAALFARSGRAQSRQVTNRGLGDRRRAGPDQEKKGLARPALSRRAQEEARALPWG